MTSLGADSHGSPLPTVALRWVRKSPGQEPPNPVQRRRFAHRNLSCSDRQARCERHPKQEDRNGEPRVEPFPCGQEGCADPQQERRAVPHPPRREPQPGVLVDVGDIDRKVPYIGKHPCRFPLKLVAHRRWLRAVVVATARIGRW